MADSDDFGHAFRQWFCHLRHVRSCSSLVDLRLCCWRSFIGWEISGFSSLQIRHLEVLTGLGGLGSKWSNHRQKFLWTQVNGCQWKGCWNMLTSQSEVFGTSFTSLGFCPFAPSVLVLAAFPWQQASSQQSLQSFFPSPIAVWLGDERLSKGDFCMEFIWIHNLFGMNLPYLRVLNYCDITTTVLEVNVPVLAKCVENCSVKEVLHWHFVCVGPKALLWQMSCISFAHPLWFLGDVESNFHHPVLLVAASRVQCWFALHLAHMFFHGWFGQFGQDWSKFDFD